MANKLFSKMRKLTGAAFIASALSLGGPLLAQGRIDSTSTSATIPEAVAFREETQAYTIGVQAMIYGQPIVSFSSEMRAQASPYATWTPGSRVTPVNAFYNYGKLAEPGYPNPRSPNRDTIYYQAWIDLRASPLVITSPDTRGRYYNLDFVDFYSETNAHTGRRTTGTAAQKAFVVGPDWKGEVPAGMHLVRMATNQGYVFGRMYVGDPKDVKTVNALISQFKIEPLDPAATAPPLQLATDSALDSMDFFVVLNRFLRDNYRKPEEAALMSLFDQIGVGPAKAFDPATISPATRRGLERALKDGRAMIRDGRRVIRIGWAPVSDGKLGVYGSNYLLRAAVNYTGLLANLPEESVYPRLTLDLKGRPMSGERRYRLSFNKDVPVDAFWSITAYDAKTFDLIPNPLKRYSVGSNIPDLKVGKDGTIVVELAPTPPKDRSVNWLVVPNGPYYLTMRFYQPRPEVLDGTYKLPSLVEISEDGKPID